MTKIARSSGLLVATLLGLGLPGICQAEPFGLRLSYTDDLPTTITITWNTVAEVPSEVRFGTSPGVYPSSEIGSTVAGPGELGFIHEVTLTGLEPDTTYWYIAGDPTDGFAAERTLATRPLPHESCGSLSFAYLGDNRPDPTFGGGQNWAQILEQAASHRPSFVLNGGDLVTDGDNLEGWVDFLDWTAPTSAAIPFMPCLGNHDNGPGEGDGAVYNRLFALPRSTGENGSGTEDYYFFTYGNAIFVVLSTETFMAGATPMAEQAAWLDRVLTENPRKWKFVMLHKPIYTKEVLFDISHAPNEEGQNATLVPIFDAHHVDVVFTSHNHWYERFEPSACASQGRPGSDQPCPVGADNFAGGTVYYVSGGAGAFTIPGFLCGSQDGRVLCSGDHHYILGSIDNEVLTLQTWSAYPQDHEILDSVTLTKPADNCDDQCPSDPLKTEPGQCGCGVADTDRDADGTADCLDACPDDPLKTAPGACGCGQPEADPCQDLCPDDPAKTEPGQCGCGVPDTDRDADGTADCLDLCPDDPLKTAPGPEGCGTQDQAAGCGCGTAASPDAWAGTLLLLLALAARRRARARS